MTSTKNMTQLVQSVAGDAVAPPWFAGAMAAALAPIESRLQNVEIKLHNVLAVDDEDEIRPPKCGPHDPAVDFPTTVRGIRELTVGGLLSRIETYYQLPHTGTLEARRKRVAKTYGFRIVVTHTTTYGSL